MPSFPDPLDTLTTAEPPARTAARLPHRRGRFRRGRWLMLGAVVLVIAVVVSMVEMRSRPGDVPVGDLPGWHQVFADDFSAAVPLGGFPGSMYGSRWTGYEGLRDTSGAGTYSNARVVSVHDGVLDMYLHTEDGTPLVAAPVPLVNGQWGGQVYGRFSVRFRADPVPGYKTAWLLWPDSNEWAEGEVDFPEGSLDDSMYAANLCVGKPGKFCFQKTNLGSYQQWHVATIEWTPKGVSFILDGRRVGTSSQSPSTPMHWVLQTETTSGKPPASASGHVEIDWVAIYTMTKR